MRKRVSPAPIRIPSSANTAPLAGCMSANSSQISWARSTTSSSPVKARGTTSIRASMTSPKTAPAATPHSIIRRAAACAASASPAPSVRPTITWPAIAIASSTSARNTNSWKAIWCAPSESLPTRASTALATRKDPYSAAVRTKISRPIRASGRMRASDGRRESAGADRSARTNAAPIPAWATTVAAAEPDSPQSSP